MPTLDEITYSRDECIAAITDYYEFLIAMYMRDSSVVKPPEDGWPSITADNFSDLGKTDEVIELLRRLPYVQDDRFEDHETHCAAFNPFINWEACGRELRDGEVDASLLRAMSEGSLEEDVPGHVVGLTYGGPRHDDMLVFLLDTELGVVYWPNCVPEVGKINPFRETIEDEYEFRPENERVWREDGAAWAVTDFFEVLKNELRSLNSIPLSSRMVVDVYSDFSLNQGSLVDMVRKIYREHGWPDLERYCKEDCIKAVHQALKEHFERDADWREDEE